jgi:hypothetical protein
VSAVAHKFSNSAEITHKTRTDIPASATLRPLRDVLIVEPLDGNLSAIIHVINECKPVRGIVKAVGPGHYPYVYLDEWGDRLPDHRREKRKKLSESPTFIPTTIKVGDVVNLGGLDIGGYSFDSFYWGDTLHLMCREADVAGVEGEISDA